MFYKILKNSTAFIEITELFSKQYFKGRLLSNQCPISSHLDKLLNLKDYPYVHK